MRKYFEDLSFYGGVLIIVSTFFGILLRIYDLDLISHWSDELASIYYAKHLNLVFLEETHPPGFYVLSKILFLVFDPTVLNLRYAVAIASVVSCVTLSLYSRKIISKAAWPVFNVLLFLLPFDVAYARIARMYSPLFVLSLWFFLALMDENRKKWVIPLLSFLMSWLFPIGFIPGGCYLVYEFYRKRKFSAEYLATMFTTLSVVFYYVLRMLLQSKKQFLSDYLGGENKVRNLFEDFFYNVAGDHIPKFPLREYPHVWIGFLLVTIVLVGLSFWAARKSERLKMTTIFHLFVLISTGLFFEVFSALVINIKLGRYLVFIIPLILIHGATGVADWSLKRINAIAGLLLVGLLSYHVYIYKPFFYFQWEREAFLEFKGRLDRSSSKEYVFCGNRFQYDYYFLLPHKHCMHEYERLKNSKIPFTFIDMNGFMQMALLEIAKTHRVSNITYIGSSLIADISPK